MKSIWEVIWQTVITICCSTLARMCASTKTSTLASTEYGRIGKHRSVRTPNLTNTKSLAILWAFVHCVEWLLMLLFAVVVVTAAAALFYSCLFTMHALTSVDTHIKWWYSRVHKSLFCMINLKRKCYLCWMVCLVEGQLNVYWVFFKL